ncbi:hypothetical protein BJY04DRAFT_190920 [Aspergillus karnatakaensis]|uniref:uncharacterized protein n=1 Tax=Aspergillus karnatakaensis TaxID=1810916 RepID=UPI003CCD08AE
MMRSAPRLDYFLGRLILFGLVHLVSYEFDSNSEHLLVSSGHYLLSGTRSLKVAGGDRTCAEDGMMSTYFTGSTKFNHAPAYSRNKVNQLSCRGWAPE